MTVYLVCLFTGCSQLFCLLRKKLKVVELANGRELTNKLKNMAVDGVDSLEEEKRRFEKFAAKCTSFKVSISV